MRQRILAGIILSLTAVTTMAASVQIIPTPTGVCCSAGLINGQFFVLTVTVTGMPGNGSTTGVTGGTFTLNFDSTKVFIAGVVLPATATIPVTATPPANTTSNPFDFISPLTTIDANNVAFSVMRNGTTPFNYASGNFVAFKITGVALPGALPGPANIVLVDDGAANSWKDQDANAVTGVSYTQANISVCNLDGCGTTPITPIPAAVWLLGSALGVLGVMRRRAAA